MKHSGERVDKKNLFSIITVCYNAQDTIEATIQSVIEQKETNYEYIIIDGQSTDNTVEIIKKYADFCPQIIWKSEIDDGIYDAMNKGVSRSKGEYVFFLNSGDSFSDYNVLGDVQKYISQNPVDIVCGDINQIYKEKVEVKRYSKSKISILQIVLQRFVCHQALFTRRNLYFTKKFDVQFKYLADNEWLAYQLQQKKVLGRVSRVICNYDMYGVSADDKNLKQRCKEADLIVKRYSFGLYLLTQPVKILFRKMRKKTYDYY